jgi:glycosyltransferase involved in cell wall biosynthesis
LNIGGGTRLKIYEAMAACTPTVSTRVGAEGLVACDPTHIRIADSPGEFAQHCLALLNDDSARAPMIEAALDLVRRDFSWEQVAREFEALLER